MVSGWGSVLSCNGKKLGSSQVQHMGPQGIGQKGGRLVLGVRAGGLTEGCVYRKDT